MRNDDSQRASIPDAPAAEGDAGGAPTVLVPELLLEQSDGDHGLAAQLLELFRELQPARIADLKAAIECGDMPAVKSSAHLLAGAFATIAMPSLSTLMRSMEQAAQQGDAAAVGSMVAVLDRDGERAMDEAKTAEAAFRRQEEQAA